MYEQEKEELEEYSEKNGSTSERGIEQSDGSLVVLRSAQGEPCTEFTLSAEERTQRGWPPIEQEEPS